MVRSISDKKKNLSQNVLNILQTISSFENIPRKKAKFLNFMKNSFRYMKANDLEEAWTLLEEAMKENKSEVQQQQQQNGKRKLETTEENGTAPKKVKGDEEEELIVEEEAKSEKFNWSETIRNILQVKSNEINLKKLKKKVLNRYKKAGGELSDKIENKFNKKLKKLNGIVVDNEKVRLIE